MKKIVFVFCLSVAGFVNALRATETYVYATNGVILCTPRQLPSSGVRLDTHQIVMGLYSASDTDRAACGWYRYVSTNETPDGMVVSNSWREIVGYEAVEFATYRPFQVMTNWDISKYQLLVNLKATNLLDTFTTYLNSDDERKLLWDAATSLDFSNELVQAAMTNFIIAEGIDGELVTNIVWRSRIRKGRSW